MTEREPTHFEGPAEPVLAWGETLVSVRGQDTGALLRQASALLDRFGSDLTAAGAIASAVPPARYALALILDQKARSNRRIDMRTWAVGSQRYLFDGRDISTASLRDFIRKAEAAGPEFAGVGQFLESCLARIEGQRQRFDRSTGASWTGIVLVLVTGFCLAVAGWTGWVEWRFHRELSRVFDAEILQIGLDRSGEIPDLVQRLDRLASAAERVRAQESRAPIRLFAAPFGFEAASNAQDDYSAAVQRHLPVLIARRIDQAIASEGKAIELYDDLRAWSILSGVSDWSAIYLAGWVADRAEVGLNGLAPHVAQLRPPERPLPQPDAELLAQARTFAIEAEEVERAFLELGRSQAVAELAEWRAEEAVPGISEVLQRRSGLAMEAPVAGLYKSQGWDHARDVGAGNAVQAARREAAALFASPPVSRNNAPDLVMEKLQRQTVATWAAYLADLRVKPFSDADAAVRISGRLALTTSPLATLLREIWAQAGGNDRRRSHAQQLSIATEFAPMIQYVEQGRMGEVSDLFAGLNVALGAMDRDAETGLQRLMSAQDRAASIAALRQAPIVVVQIVEDVLAQSSAAHADLLTNPLTRAWQAEVLPICRETVEGRFPFAEGADADMSAMARLFAPGGAIDRYFRARAEAYIDVTTRPWRWKPEARFAGLTPESAVIFQRAQAISTAFFGADGRAGADLTLAALAERGKAFVAIGGAGGAVETSTEGLRLAWPGSAPEKGIEVSFQTPEGAAQLAEPGEWGLIRLLAPLRLRERDEGRRFLVDLRASGARLFLEIGFASPDNPLAVRGLLGGFSCPPVL